MNIVVNGEAMCCDDNLTIQDLLVQKGLVPEGIIVERNAQFVQRSEFHTTILSEGDCLELIRFVAGG